MALLRRAARCVVIALLLQVGLLTQAAPASACSLGGGPIDLDSLPHPRFEDAVLPGYDDRLIRVEVVAQTPRARDFVVGGVVVGTHAWRTDDEPAPLTLIVDDGRDMTSEWEGCWSGHDVPPIGASFVVSVVGDPERVLWRFVGDDQAFTDRLGEPTPLPRDDAETEQLIGQLHNSRPMAARISVLIPLGLWTPVVLIAGLVLGMGAHRKRTKPQSVGGLAAP